MSHAVIHARCIPGKDGFSLLIVNPRLALMYRALKRPGKGGRMDRIQCAYFGFDSEESANAFIAWLKAHYDPGIVQAREPERLSDCAVEVKVREFPELMPVVLKCAARHAAQAVPAEATADAA